MRKKLRLVSLIVTAAFLGISVLYYFSPKEGKTGFRYFVHRITGNECNYNGQQIFSRKLRDRVPDYIKQSSLRGISKSASRKELLKQVSSGKLVRISNGRGYILEDFTHSYPYLTKDGRALLKEIGKRFRKKIFSTRLRGSSFTITSMTRTTEGVKKLRGSNSNASENSPHFYGNAFDISYVNFLARKWYVTECDKYYLKEALAEVIWQLKSEKKCWATYEINQGCFHVVAR